MRIIREVTVLKLSRKKVFLLGGYIMFNFFVAVTCMRVMGRLGSAMGRFNLNLGEVLNHLWASLLPSPF
jgi:hypothetical protein